MRIFPLVRDVARKRKGALQQNSLSSYERVARHLQEIFPQLEASRFRPGHVDEYITARRNSGAAIRSVNLELSIIRCCLKRTGRWDALKETFKLLPRAPLRGVALTEEEAARILAAAKEGRAAAIFYPMV